MSPIALMTTVLFSITFVQVIQAGNTLILAYPKEIILISSFLKKAGIFQSFLLVR